MLLDKICIRRIVVNWSTWPCPLVCGFCHQWRVKERKEAASWLLSWKVYVIEFGYRCSWLDTSDRDYCRLWRILRITWKATTIRSLTFPSDEDDPGGRMTCQSIVHIMRRGREYGQGQRMKESSDISQKYHLRKRGSIYHLCPTLDLIITRSPSKHASLPYPLSSNHSDATGNKTWIEEGKGQSKGTEHAYIFLSSCSRFSCWQWQNLYKAGELVLTDGRFLIIYICSDVCKGPKYSRFLSQSKKM